MPQNTVNYPQVNPKVRPVAYKGAASASVGTTSGTLVAAGAYTSFLQISTLPGSTSNVWLRADGTAAVANTGILVGANGGSVNFGGIGFPLPTAAITAIADGASAQVVTLAGG